MNKIDVESVIERLAIHSPKCKFCGYTDKNKLQPIMIGDIIEKIYAIDDDCADMENDSFVEDLIWLWKKCGASKSLQEIIDDSGWEIIAEGNMVYEGFMVKDSFEQLAKPEARALFKFIDNLDLK